MSRKKKSSEELVRLEKAIRAQENLRGIIADLQLDSILADLRQQKKVLLARLEGGGTQAIGENSLAVGAQGIGIAGNVHGDVITGLKVDKIELVQRQSKNSLKLRDALARYLDNIIGTHQHLRLQGIRAGSQPLGIPLEKVYVSLSAYDKQSKSISFEKRDGKTKLFAYEFGYMPIAMALQRHDRLVVIGDPGCGKTTLIAYLGLTFARALKGEKGLISKRLGLKETPTLPILLPLRDLAQHLREKYSNSGIDGPSILLDFLLEYYVAQQIPLPEQFFSRYLEKGGAVLLLDGMDEVADPEERQRVARLIEKFAVRYDKCRFVVTSREVGYEGTSRIGANFGLVKVRDFSPQEVRAFLRDWTRAVETTLSDVITPDVLRLADENAERLIKAIESNQRVADLAVNPLLLTVIALVHRYRAQLPERRSELYEESIEVLLGHWDRAKGLVTRMVLAGRELDAGDLRSLLEPVALWMHERKKRDIERDDLHSILLPAVR